MVNVRGQQFSASNMEELRKLAKKGMLSGGDIVQPPGASEWLYAMEVPELKGSLAAHHEYDDLPSAAAGLSPTVKAVAALVMAGVAVVAWTYAISLSNNIPKPEDLELIGGSKGMTYSEVLVTADGASLHADASESSPAVGPLEKNGTADLLAKRGDYYKLRADGKEGYSKVDTVIPAYFFADEATKLDYDPIYNPDRYVYVTNSSWMLLPDAAKKNTTVFQFMVQNDSKFPMTDIRMLAAIKNDQGVELEKKEIAVAGIIPPQRSVMVGSLAPARGQGPEGRVMFSSMYDELILTEPEAAERWTDGVEVKLEAATWNGATITLLEVRAIPPDEMPTKK